MPFDTKSIPDRLKDAAATGHLIPLIGAGISKHATTADKKAFPCWRELLGELRRDAVKHGNITSDEGKQISELVKRGRYLMAAQALRDEMPADRLEQLLVDRFMPHDARPGDIHEWLFKLNSAMILTTNYDMLLEDAYAAHYSKAACAFTFRDAPQVQRALQSYKCGRDRPIIFKLHGCVGSVSDAILSEIDYRTLLYREPGYKLVLSAIFITNVVVMLGFSFSDPELVLLMETLRESLKYRSSPDYILTPVGEKNTVEKKRLREDFGLEVLEYKPSANHVEVLDFVKYLAKFAAVSPACPMGGK